MKQRGRKHLASRALHLSLAAGTAVVAAGAMDGVVAQTVQKVQKFVAFTEESGTLPDGTGYLIRVPEKWNGTLIRDLDFASGVANKNAPRYDTMLKEGYAIAGTARHPLRQWQYDPAYEVEKLNQVLDRFATGYGKPKRVIQYGCSGGAHVTLAVAENFSDRIDGAVALAAHTPVWIMNTFFDGWFALRALVGPYYVKAGYGPMSDLVIAGLTNDGSSDPSGHGMSGKLPEAWRKAFTAAHATEQGRARMVLAFAIAQWSPWLTSPEETSQNSAYVSSVQTSGTPFPDLNDPNAVAEAVYQSAMRLSVSPGGEARIMFENAAHGQQLSWNNDIDYADFLKNANPHMKEAVDSLYKKAGLDVAEDIKTINAQPRTKASDYALNYWKQPGRNTVGNPRIPVLRLHMVGDYQIPYSLVHGYSDEVKRNKKDDLYRTAFLQSTGHCNFNSAESSAAIRVMMQRLDTGSWPDTDPEAMNALGTLANTGTGPRFMKADGWEFPAYNRTWLGK